MEEFFTSWLFWLILAALFVVVELLTNTFAAFCLVGGCVVALVVAALDFGIEAQLVGAAVGAVATFIAFKPLIRRQREASSVLAQSNMDALIGRVATVTEPISSGRLGRVRIDGDSWQVTTADGSEVGAGEQVRVTGYDSIVLTVERA